MIDILMISDILAPLKHLNMSSPDIDKGSRSSWLELVQNQVDSLRFGVVQIVVHNSRVVQVERTEKVRLADPENNPGSVAKTYTNQATGGNQT